MPTVLRFYHGDREAVWGVGRMKNIFSNLQNSDVGHSPIRVSKQNVDEGSGGNFQVKVQIKWNSVKMFPKVLGDYDPPHCY